MMTHPIPATVQFQQPPVGRRGSAADVGKAQSESERRKWGGRAVPSPNTGDKRYRGAQIKGADQKSLARQSR
jgi:hypothetical protein